MKPRRKEKPTPENVPRRTPAWWAYTALFVLTLLVYAPSVRFDFVNFDDPGDVSRNPHVRAGLKLGGIKWAITTGEGANWFPVTRISRLVDGQIYGTSSGGAGGHHATNALIHALAAVFLLAFLYRATNALWPSTFVAAVFALHPLHVESVAWVAERKDVLSALFWFACLWAYVRYTEKRSAAWYAVTLAAFGLGLMSKPMIVTLPFLLLLLDVWPLKRFRPQVFLEKIPFLALTIAGAATTYLVQQSGGAVRTGQEFSLGSRVENSLVSYVWYIVKTLCPMNLAAFYPYPHAIPLWQPLLAAACLVGVSAGVVLAWKARPYLAVGWFWYVGTLVPVIGIVMVGVQARADRYTYVPMTGLAIMLAWSAAELLERRPGLRKPAIAAGAILCVAMIAGTELQLRHWKNSEALFRHALDVTDNNYLAAHNLGVALALDQRYAEAIEQYRASLRMEPNEAATLTDYGAALEKTGRITEGIVLLRRAVALAPDAAVSHNNLANALLSTPGGQDEAIAEYQTALRLQPDYPDARNNLQRALTLSAETEYNTGVDLAHAGRAAEAIEHFEAALLIKPDYVDARNNLGVVLAGTGRTAEAIAHFETALKIDPRSAEAQENLAIARAEQRRKK